MNDINVYAKLADFLGEPSTKKAIVNALTTALLESYVDQHPEEARECLKNLVDDVTARYVNERSKKNG